ncbi:dUTP diphosphatase [Candidatus Formimonas warabiya]|uniref:Deoxyuridine 5'-triphosphate nucleotidohydrolase n=1 Tax=Formimonas warabiya TaxID=1761012 RepID=A0A3G1KP25_FORW1|nr:dUTP diphosphatase [Candidatus Formimonas warabiya]ATW24214.1 deoxyuridine 5'-triphosphate nucleotidohydrolase [Candidatus Formimonas warabiya]
MGTVKIGINYCHHYEGLPKPEYQTAGAAGFDLLAAIDHDRELKPGDFQLMPTGIKIELPFGYEGQVRPRSGLALKHGITVLNSPGTIDSDYRGEIQVILINFSKNIFLVTRGMRIAQLVVSEITKVELAETLSLHETERNSGGFGHTGW